MNFYSAEYDCKQASNEKVDIMIKLCDVVSGVPGTDAPQTRDQHNPVTGSNRHEIYAKGRNIGTNQDIFVIRDHAEEQAHEKQ